MEKKPSAMSYLKKGILLVILTAATFYFVLRGENLREVLAAAAKADWRFLAVGVAAMCIYITCEGMNLRRCVRMLGHRVSFFHSLRYAFSGFFGSAITPFSSGGQPLQAYYMSQDGVPLSHATLALLVQLSCYHFVSVILSTISFLSQYRLLRDSVGGARFALLAGILINAGLLVFYLAAIFSKRIMPAVVNFGVRVLHKLGIKSADSIGARAEAQLEKYRSGAVVFRQNRRDVVFLVLTALLQVVCLHSVPYWVYRSFGLNSASFFSVVSLQILLYVTVAVIPLPGAVGASEGGFLLLFSLFFPKALLSSAMLLSRGVSFYLFVFVSVVFLAFDLIRTNLRAHRLRAHASSETKP